LAFGICFAVVYNYFRKLKSPRALKYALLIGGIYGFFTLMLVYIGGQPTKGPNVGVMTAIFMVALAVVINIPLHYLRKWFIEGYHRKETKQN
jgi:drug/metabolite transporter (DMT)-like permease